AAPAVRGDDDRVVAGDGRDVLLRRGAADGRAVETPLVARCTARRQRDATAGAESGRAAGNGRCGRDRIDGHGNSGRCGAAATVRRHDDGVAAARGGVVRDAVRAADGRAVETPL